jgi:NCS2 family nucleobase:cation symporter-2
MKGVRNGVLIFLSTGYCVGTVVAMLLNFILPRDALVIGRGNTEVMSEEPSEKDVYKDDTVDVEAVDVNESMDDTGDVEAVDVSESMERPEEAAENNVGKEESISFRA